MSDGTAHAPLRRGRRLLLTAVAATVVALAAGGSPARAQEVHIDALRFTFDRERNRFTYEDGRLTLGDVTLFAQEMALDADTGVVTATGFVRFETPTLSGTAAEVELDAKGRMGAFRNVQVYDSRAGLYLRAEELLLLPNGTLQLRHCSFTTCPPDVPGGWSVSATELTLAPDQLAIAWNPVVRVGVLPVLWLPGVAWPAVRERRSGLLPPRLAQDRSSLERFDLGWRLALPFFWNLGFDHDLTITTEGIENRGAALELDYNYAFRSGQRGQLVLWGVRERDPRDPLVENDILPTGEAALRDEPLRRFRADWTHNDPIGNSARAVLSYHHAGDGQVRREYDRVTEYRPYRTYQASVTRQDYWADAALTFEQNADYTAESVYADTALQTDRELRPQLLPRLALRLGGRFSNRFPLALGVSLSGTRFEARQDVSGRLTVASPVLTLPIALGAGWELRPRLTRHFVGYTALDVLDAASGLRSQPDEQTFSQSEGTLELRTTLGRAFPLDDGRYAALKHRITPRLILTGLEDVPQPFGDRVLRARPAMQLATLRLDNVLLGRLRNGGGQPGAVRELLRLDLVQRYNRLLEDDAPALEGPAFERRQETVRGEPLLPLRLELTAQGPHYTATALLNYHHQLSRTTESALSISGRLTPHMALAIGYRFNEFPYLTPDNKLIPAANAVTFRGEMAWSDRLSVGFDGRADLSDAEPPLGRRIDRGQAFVDYHTVCYAVRLTYAEAVASTLVNGEETFFVDRSVGVSFKVGGALGRPEPPSLAGAPAAPAVARASHPTQCRG